MADIVESGKESIQTNNGILTISKNNDNFLFYDGSVYRMIIGLDDNGQPTIKISEAGQSVLDATDDQLIFNSNNNLFKIVSTGVATINKGASVAEGSVSVPHNLGYTPAMIAYITSTAFGEAQLLPLTQVWLGGTDAGKVTITVSGLVDDSQIFFQALTPNFASNTLYTSALSYDIRYYLLRETAN